ncbi:MAG: 50S ribosomal protein L20 [Elusimicrobia bacterium]|jgi:large subunit ribosomal protein L20|nr:50S ribosomal protein L20 [Elusimicrobiota bacterium]
MPRATNAPASRQRRKKVLNRAKGYRQGRSKLYRKAREFSEKGLTYAYRDRRAKKRTFRALWITRIAAACKNNDISYSQFISGIKKADVQLNRKSLADIAFNNPNAFADIAAKAKEAIHS